MKNIIYVIILLIECVTAWFVAHGNITILTIATWAAFWLYFSTKVALEGKNQHLRLITFIICMVILIGIISIADGSYNHAEAISPATHNIRTYMNTLFEERSYVFMVLSTIGILNILFPHNTIKTIAHMIEPIWNTTLTVKDCFTTKP